MNRCCIYKIKDESMKLFNESVISPYVYVHDFGVNPLLGRDELYYVYSHVFIEDLNFTSKIDSLHILPSEDFEKHFDLFMDSTQINEKLKQLEEREN